MKKFTKFVLLLLPLLFTCAAAAASAQTTAEMLTVLCERVEVAKANQSIAAAFIHEKGIRFASCGKTAPGPAGKAVDENTVYEIGSVTKVFTGALLAEAVRRGEVRLDDPISKHLPPNVKAPARGGREITLLDLATHTSGLPRLPSNLAPKDIQNPYADYTVEQMYDFLSKYELKRDIGASYEYSNLGTGLLGHILSLRAGMSYEDLVKNRILKPLGMNDTTVTLSPALKSRTAPGFDENGEPASLWDLPALAGAGALRSTTKDMAKFVAANLGLEKTDLNAAFLEARRPQRDVREKTKIGLGWHISSSGAATAATAAATANEIVWHTGGTGGFRSYVGFDPARKKGVVVLSNSAEPVEDIGAHLLDAQMPLRKIKPPLIVAEKTLDEYVGEYELAPGAVFTITRTGDRLFAQLSGQPRFRVFAEAENKFYYKVVKAQLTFNRSGTGGGKIESLTLAQNGAERTAKKIK